jgi:molybdate transport system ATP-binding protein
MSVQVEITRTLGGFSLAAAFECGPGVTALFGPSGAGKTSLVQMIAGLLRPDAGRIAVGGTVLFDDDARIDLPPHERRIGYVFQDARLFPHMDVRRNLDYGARRRGGETVQFDAVVETLGIGHLLDRRPGALSGGERQRVAIGRALLSAPRLLLMDEPLASLDTARKQEIIPFIERMCREIDIPVVYVSHAVDEVLQLADEMVLLRDGSVVASGPVEDVMNRPDLVRTVGNGDSGSVIGVTVEGVDADYGIAALSFAGGTFRVTAPDLATGDNLRIRVRARDVSLALDPPTNVSVLNVFEGTVATIAPSDGPQADVEVRIGDTPIWSRVTRKSRDELGLVPGTRVYAMVKAVALDRPSRPR